MKSREAIKSVTTYGVITAHNGDYLAIEHPPIWRVPSRRADHEYRGVGRSSNTRLGDTQWSPCEVCGKPFRSKVHAAPYPLCSFCGSIHPESLIELAPLALHVEFADWKYGYPHKLYIDFPRSQRAKFYTRHLQDFPALIVDFNDAFGPSSGMVWHIHPELGLGFSPFDAHLTAEFKGMTAVDTDIRQAPGSCSYHRVYIPDCPLCLPAD